ncbi:MAG: hypothetical protein L0Y55_10100 [Anaerolineales bacterium]|nr:hypothetical protein [Anaerolineales bacterium]
MFQKIILLGTLLLVFALSATACQGVPNLAPAPAPTETPTVAPTPGAPAAPPVAPAKPQLPDRQKVEGALRLADLSGGIVSENKNGVLALRVGRQIEQVQTNAQTIVVMPGKTKVQVADIRVGDRVIVDYGAETNTTAALLLDLPSDYATGNVMLAAVVSVRGGTLNVRTRSGDTRVAASAETVIVNLSGDKPALGALKDLKPGNAVIVIGQDNNDTVNAQVIVVTDRDARALLNRGRGNPQGPAPTPTPKPGA